MGFLADETLNLAVNRVMTMNGEDEVPVEGGEEQVVLGKSGLSFDRESQAIAQDISHANQIKKVELITLVLPSAHGLVPVLASVVYLCMVTPMIGHYEYDWIGVARCVEAWPASTPMPVRRGTRLMVSPG